MCDCVCVWIMTVRLQCSVGVALAAGNYNSILLWPRATVQIKPLSLNSDPFGVHQPHHHQQQQRRWYSLLMMERGCTSVLLHSLAPVGKSTIHDDARPIYILICSNEVHHRVWSGLMNYSLLENYIRIYYIIGCFTRTIQRSEDPVKKLRSIKVKFLHKNLTGNPIISTLFHFI